MGLAQTCGFNWKCKEPCVQDFSKNCPEDGSEVPRNPGLCMAPATYAGLCSFSVNTARMTPQQKDAFAQKCLAKFPCMSAEALAKAAARAAHHSGLMPDGPVAQTGRILPVSPTGQSLSALKAPLTRALAQPLPRADRISKFFYGLPGPVP